MASNRQVSQMIPVALEQNTYDLFAHEYAQHLKEMREQPFSIYHDLVIPSLLDCVGEVSDLAVLDAGCGEGTLARLLAGRGARVTAVDISPRLVELARAQDPQDIVTYHVHDLSRPLPQYEQSFDVVVSNLVLNDVPDYQGFVNTLAAVTKPGGRLVL